MKNRVTNKFMLSAIRKADWDRRIEVLILKNQGWENAQIARKFGVTRAAITEMLLTMGGLTVEEAELLSRL